MAFGLAWLGLAWPDLACGLACAQAEMMALSGLLSEEDEARRLEEAARRAEARRTGDTSRRQLGEAEREVHAPLLCASLLSMWAQ